MPDVKRERRSRFLATHKLFLATHKLFLASLKHSSTATSSSSHAILMCPRASLFYSYMTHVS